MADVPVPPASRASGADDPAGGPADGTGSPKGALRKAAGGGHRRGSGLSAFGGLRAGAYAADGEHARATHARIATFESKSHVERRYSARFGVIGGEHATASWLIAAAVGVGVGLLSYLIHLFSYKLTKLKFKLANSFIEGSEGGADMVRGYLVYAAALVVITLPGVAMVLWKPAAESSGIPGVMAYVNGVRLEGHVDWQTGLATTVGVTFAVASGLACGPEGPVIHIGACVGRAMCGLFPRLRLSGHVLRNMVALGAGAGVAAAFLAPASGVALVLEDLAYVSVEEIHKTFIACVAAYWTSYWLQAAQAGDTTLNVKFNVGNISEHPECFYAWWAIPIFILLGAICGCMGALFNWLAVKINTWRMANVTAKMPLRRVVEVVLVGLVTASLFTWAPSAFPCRHKTAGEVYDKATTSDFCPNPHVESQIVDKLVYPGSELFNHTLMTPEKYEDSDQKPYQATYVEGWEQFSIDEHLLSQYACPEGEYNAAASLLFVPAPEAIKLLFSEGLTRAVAWHEVLVTFVLYFTMAVITVGIALPTGLVVPNIFMGACLGRLMGLACVPLGVPVEPGVMAIVGAAAMMAGSGRIMLFFTILVVELTSALLLAPPIACATIAAVIVGNLFNDGLYHEFIHLKCLPVVGDHPNELQERACVGDVMAAPAVCMRETDSVQEALAAKRSTSHNGFPVVDRDGALVGVVSTSMLERVQVDPDATVADVMDGSPVAVRAGDALGRSIRLFRRLGMRHLPVVDGRWVPIGIVTRKNLMPWVVEGKAMQGTLKYDGPEEDPDDLKRAAEMKDMATALKELDEGVAARNMEARAATEDLPSRAVPLAADAGEEVCVESAPTVDFSAGDSAYPSPQNTPRSSLRAVSVPSTPLCAVPLADTPAKAQASRKRVLAAAAAAVGKKVVFADDLPRERQAAVHLWALHRGLPPPLLSAAMLPSYRVYTSRAWRTCVVASTLLLISLCVWERPRPAGILGGAEWSPSADAWILFVELLLLGVHGADCFLAMRARTDAGVWPKLKTAAVVLAAIEGAILLVVHAAGVSEKEYIDYVVWRPGRYIRAVLLMGSTTQSRFVSATIARCAPAVLRVMAVVAAAAVLFALVGYAGYSTLTDSAGFVFEGFGSYHDALESFGVASTLSNFPAVMMPYYSYAWPNALFFMAFVVLTAFVLTFFLDAAVYAALVGSCQTRAATLARRRKEVLDAIFEELSSGLPLQEGEGGKTEACGDSEDGRPSGLPLYAWRRVFSHLEEIDSRFATLALQAADAAAGSDGSIGADARHSLRRLTSFNAASRQPMRSSSTPAELADVLFLAARARAGSATVGANALPGVTTAAGEGTNGANGTDETHMPDSHLMLSAQQFGSLVELLEHPMRLECAEGTLTRPTKETAARLKPLRTLVTRPAFEVGVILTLIMQGALIAVRVGVHRRDDDSTAVNAVAVLFSMAFALELAAKIAARVHPVLRLELWGTLDAAVIVVSAVLDVAKAAGASAGFVNFFPLLRCLRIVNMGSSVVGFRTLGRAFQGLASVMCAFALAIGGFLHVVALTGVAVFRGAVRLVPEASDLLEYCDRALRAVEVPYLGGEANRTLVCTDTETGLWLDADDGVMVERMLERVSDRPCYLHYVRGGEGVVPCEALNPALAGTEYEARAYFRNSFADWPSALVTLFELLCGNDWHIVKDGMVAGTSEPAQVFFFVAYAASAVLATRVLFAFSFEAFLAEFAASRSGAADAGEARARLLGARIAAAEDRLLKARASPYERPRTASQARRWIISGKRRWMDAVTRRLPL